MTSPVQHSDARKTPSPRPGCATHMDTIYNSIIQHHQSTGGKMGLLIDVGCSTGGATRELGKSFDKAIGVDINRDRISMARTLGGRSATGGAIKYYESAAEDVDKLGIWADQQADLLVAMSSAHWFDLPKFWAVAAKVLRSGGTVALWTHGPLHCNFPSPNAVEAQKILSDWQNITLMPYIPEQIGLSHNLYVDLPLPWDVGTSGFDKTTLIREEWSEDESLLNEKDTFSSHLLSRGGEPTLQTLRNISDNSIISTRWRSEHPELASTDQDCVELLMSQIRNTMKVSRSEEKDTKIALSLATVLIMFKKSS